MAKKKTTKRSKKSAPFTGAARKRAAPKASLADALAAAAWAEADEALAEALVEFDELESASDASTRAAAMDMLAQALARVARRRGLTRIGALGAREAFDAAKHDFQGVRAPKTVRISARGVARGAAVLRRPRVSSLRRKPAR